MIDYENIYCSFMKGRVRPLYTEMYPRLLRYALRILGPELSYLAEDCVQEAIMNTYIRRRELTDMQKWRAWLLTAVRNNSLMMLRKEELGRRYAEHGMLSENIQEDVSLMVIEQETYRAIFDIIDSLPGELRELFDLSFRQGLKNAEVANLLKVAEITVKKRKARLLDTIRQRLGRNLDDKSLSVVLALISISTDAGSVS